MSDPATQHDGTELGRITALDRARQYPNQGDEEHRGQAQGRYSLAFGVPWTICGLGSWTRGGTNGLGDLPLRLGLWLVQVVSPYGAMMLA